MIIFGNNDGETCWDRSTFYPAQFGAFNPPVNPSHQSNYTDWNKEGYAGYSYACQNGFSGCNCEKCKVKK